MNSLLDINEYIRLIGWENESLGIVGTIGHGNMPNRRVIACFQPFSDREGRVMRDTQFKRLIRAIIAYAY